MIEYVSTFLKTLNITVREIALSLAFFIAGYAFGIKRKEKEQVEWLLEKHAEIERERNEEEWY